MTLPVPRTIVGWILTVAAALAPAAAVLFAHYLSDATWWLSITFGVLTGIAVYLASREATTEAKAADVGRGVIVGLLVTIALSWIDHQGNERAERQRGRPRRSLGALSSRRRSAADPAFGASISAVATSPPSTSRTRISRIRTSRARTCGTPFCVGVRSVGRISPARTSGERI